MSAEPRYDAEGNPAPPWGCGKYLGLDLYGEPFQCEWGLLCNECESRRTSAQKESTE